MGNVLKTILASDNVGLYTPDKGRVYGYGINDTQIQLFNGDFKYGCLITIKDGYLEMSDTDYGVKYLGRLKYDFNDEEKMKQDFKKYYKELQDIALKEISEKMLGFVRILEQ